MSPKSHHRTLCHHCHRREPTHCHLGRILLCTPCYRYLRCLIEEPQLSLQLSSPNPKE